ncbi:hypothetical protein HRM2_14720 [Desulforapulum autotrophicum HRM2]|uniref:Uncharacterized protein n=1 Tax=Desulforapulum autotrophicum (strain ATCC 43914 / DSM 3382 / VKM B-1955 / HRM2) TaxID=177437 RepID=C0Q9L7_DESAH|nr:hypothetical protein [Desulforapulum autotrophicum]ACN14581.1 hypothetical protein HRM2_14720 [Desulforapulum autotrophicum HRM2]
MIYEYAVSPELFSSATFIQTLQHTFGKEEGRLFSEIPKKIWQRQVFEVIKVSENKPVMRKTMQNAVKNLFKKALYKRNNHPAFDGSEWLQFVINVHSERPFRAIIADQYEGDEKFVLVNNLDLADQPLWTVPKDVSVDREHKVMVQQIRSMLNCASEIILVDRNFKPETQRFQNVLSEIMEMLSKRTHGPSIAKVVYHTGDSVSVGYLENQCLRHIKPIIPSGMRLEVVVWPKDKLHDRFVLTNIGGVLFGQGLDERLGFGPDKILITRLSDDTYKEWWSLCKNKTTDFTICSS